MKLRLGLDIGIASVGYGIIDENYQVLDSGVRLFTEAKPEKNLTRRTMRGTRRRIRRRHHRLMRMGIMLADILEIDCPEPFGNIYEIRCRGLQQRLSKEEFFLAVLHLSKYRGTHFLTAEDFVEVKGEKNTSELLDEQAKQLKDKYVCELQYEKLQQEGRVRGIENRFRNKAYRRELCQLLAVQAGFYAELTEDVQQEILKIYDSKREYYDGPGSEKSPTPYGCWRYNEQGEVEHVNLIDIMRGKCSIFPGEQRIAQQSYTSCLFNLLNDLNNIRIDGRHITWEEKNLFPWITLKRVVLVLCEFLM